MDRRTFLRSAFGAAGAAVAVAALAPTSAGASTLFDELKGLDANAAPAGDLPAEGASESQYYWRRRHWRRRRRCWWRRNRWGQPVRVCRW